MKELMLFAEVYDYELPISRNISQDIKNFDIFSLILITS